MIFLYTFFSYTFSARLPITIFAMPNFNPDILRNIFKKKEHQIEEQAEELFHEAEEFVENWQEGTAKVPFYKQKKGIAVIGCGVFLLLLLSIVGVFGWRTYTTLLSIKTQAREAETIARNAYTNVKTQNLPGVSSELKNLSEKLDLIKNSYESLSFYNSIPIAREYYQDGLHGIYAARAGLSAAKKSIDAVTPYADVLGFTGEGTFSGGTAEDRLKIIIETVDKVMPVIDSIATDLQIVESELSQIDETKYPENFRNIPVRSYLLQVKELGATAQTAVTDFRPVLEKLPTVAGGRGERKKYLILFQNDNELRPTGGFLTAYATIFVENGKVTPEKSDDIYELDKKFSTKIQIPESLGRYLTTEKYWNLRDMNISPDFKTSMDTFFQYYQTIPGEPQDIDGIIAVDTEFLKKLLTQLGPVEVPGYGTFTAENDPHCDCPQIIYILSEIITRPTPYIREDRKGILGPLMRAILTKAYSSPKETWPNLFKIGVESVAGRHIQMYFLDEDTQVAADTIDATGRMIAPPANEDFLGIVNANLGGAKSNLFVTYDVEQEVSAPTNGMIEKTVTITYKNPRAADNCNLEAGLLCLNSTLRDWTRLYVPQGSELKAAQGFLEDPKTYTESGFQVFDGFFVLEPKGQATLKVTYTVPYEDSENYKLQIWKQGGILSYPLLMDVTGGQEKLEIVKDTVYTTPF